MKGLKARAAALAAVVFVLVGSCFWLALEHGTLALWNVHVHESGHYTLGETILYFRHFLREIPVDSAIALFLAAALVASGQDRVRVHRRERLMLFSGTVALALAAVAWTVSVRQQGAAEALRDLFQFRTRDDVQSYGSHWHYHWLQLIWFGCAATILFRLRTQGRAGWRSDAARPLLIAWGVVAAGTMVFLLQPEVFLSVRYAAHQAREIMTHALVTAPLAFALLSAAMASPEAELRAAPAAVWFPAALLVAIPVWLTLVVLTGDLAAEAQTGGGLAGLVAAHFFEHVLDYVFTAALAVFAFAAFARRAG